MIRKFHKKQAGFTLIELVVSLAISWIIAIGASVASGQVLNQTERNTNYTLASRNAMNVLHWVSRDAMMAQEVSGTTNGTSGFPQTQDLSLSWVAWDNTSYSANYSLDSGTLRRIFSNGSSVITTVIAENINPDPELTNCVSANGSITVTITSSIGSGARVSDATRIRVIAFRPEL